MEFDAPAPLSAKLLKNENCKTKSCYVHVRDKRTFLRRKKTFVCSFACLFVRSFVCLFVRSFDDDDECEQTKAFQPKQSDITVEVKLF